MEGAGGGGGGGGIIDVAVYSNDFGSLILLGSWFVQGEEHVACAQCATESSFRRAMSVCGVSMGTALQVL